MSHRPFFYLYCGHKIGVEPLFLRWNKLILGLFISTYLYPHIYPLHNSWSRNFQMGTQWEKSGLSLLQETPMGTYFNLLVPTYLSSTNSWSRNFEYRRSLAYPYCRRLPWERTGRRCSFLLAWEIGGKGLGHWWETHLFPLISHRIRFSDLALEEDLLHEHTQLSLRQFPPLLDTIL